MLSCGTVLAMGFIAALCRKISASSGAATRSASSKALGKHAYYAQNDMAQADAYDNASDVMATGVTLPDGQEGITSFVEKRRPEWGPPNWTEGGAGA